MSQHKLFLGFVKSLFEIKPTIYETNNEEAFRNACFSGNLELAKQILEINKTINISSENEYAFKIACFRGHLKGAKWLLEIKPTIDISSNNHYAFRFACKNRHLNIAKWFHSLNPEIYNYEVSDENLEIIYKINTSLK